MKNIDKRKSIIEIGIQYFDFEFFKELVIYKYLCRDSLSKKEWKKLDNGIMFDSYHQWEDYILKKYENYNETKIIEKCKEKRRTRQRVLENSFIFNDGCCCSRGGEVVLG